MPPLCHAYLAAADLFDLLLALQYGSVEWTLWDRFELKGNPTMQEVVDYFQVRPLPLSMFPPRLVLIVIPLAR